MKSFLSNSLICAVHLYQSVAPERIRKRCRFTPCCSDYMILSIQKYGSRTGVKKGIDRIMRCKPPNGGYDYP
ncbi:MAG: membrane protein insertion efficiency factor YidD [Oscillospiraceae bacterium]|nr:membrane protein insertion efficiency factor YidD [Oscillospiraceae bacterium]